MDMLLEDLPSHILATMNHRYTLETVENITKVRNMATHIARHLGQDVPEASAFSAELTDLISDDRLKMWADIGDLTAVFLLNEKVQSKLQSPIEPTTSQE